MMWREALPGVWRVDVSHPSPGHTCCYLLTEKDSAALVDCGAKKGVSTVLEALTAAQMRPEQVQWIIATHSHMDHVGSAGEFLQHFPNATLVGHANALEHLVNPHNRLIPAVRRLFGDAWFDAQYAPIVPAEEARVKTLEDGATLEFGGRTLTALYTPGHAWHHLSIHDPARDIFYGGDAYGVSYAGNTSGDSFIVPVMPPSQFAPVEMAQSLRKLRDLKAAWVGLAHFDIKPNSPILAQRQIDAIDDWVEMAKQIPIDDSFADDFQVKLKSYMATVATAQGFDGVSDYHDHDTFLSSRGFEYWLKRHYRQ